MPLHQFVFPQYEITFVFRKLTNNVWQCKRNWDYNKRIFTSSNVKNQHKNKQTQHIYITVSYSRVFKSFLRFSFNKCKKKYYWYLHKAMNITVELLQQSPSTYFISHYMCVYKYKKEYCFSKMLVLLCNYFLDQVRHLLLNAELTCMTLSEYAASIIKSYLCGLYTPFL